jgi:hypothetical protein
VRQVANREILAEGGTTTGDKNILIWQYEKTTPLSYTGSMARVFIGTRLD